MDLREYVQGPGRGPSLLDLAAADELAAFRYAVKEGGWDPDALSVWYGRRNGSEELLVEQLTPAMVAAWYGSVNVLAFLLPLGLVDVNKRSRPSGKTALHYCAAGGSLRAAEVCSLLLRAGADCNSRDACGRRPADIIVNPSPQVEASLVRQLHSPALICTTRAFSPSVAVNIPGNPLAKAPGASDLDLFLPEILARERGSPAGPNEPRRDQRGYISDPSMPDVKSSEYMSDEFRMFSFKIKPCSRNYSHDWPECPFAHPGEAARRRDPRQYTYSCLPCPDFRKGACARGDTCDFAHGVFESWLHPAQYRTRLCKDGPGCDRRVCFFAHLPKELRPMNSGWGSALPLSYTSPMSPSPLEKHMQRQLSPPLPVSPSSVLLKQGPFSPGPGSPVGKHQAPFSPPKSPVASPDHMQGSPVRMPHQMMRAQRLSGEFRREAEYGYDALLSPQKGRPLSPHEVSRDFMLAEERRLAEALVAAELGALSLGARARPAPPHGSPRFRAGAGFQGGGIPPRGYERPLSPQLPPERHSRNPRSPLGGAVGLPAVQGGTYARPGNQRTWGPLDPAQTVVPLENQRSAHSRFARSSAWQGQVSDWGSPKGMPDWGMKQSEVEQLRARQQQEAANEPDISWVQDVLEDDPSGTSMQPKVQEKRSVGLCLDGSIWADPLLELRA